MNSLSLDERSQPADIAGGPVTPTLAVEGSSQDDFGFAGSDTVTPPSADRSQHIRETLDTLRSNIIDMVRILGLWHEHCLMCHGKKWILCTALPRCICRARLVTVSKSGMPGTRWSLILTSMHCELENSCQTCRDLVVQLIISCCL